MYFKTVLLVARVVLLSFVHAAVPECNKRVFNLNGCNITRLEEPDAEQKCRMINFFPLSDLSFYLYPSEKFKLLEFKADNKSIKRMMGIQRNKGIQRVRIYNGAIASNTWNNIKLKMSSSTTSEYNVYINDTLVEGKKGNITKSSTDINVVVTVNIKDCLSYFLQNCTPANWTTPPSLPTACSRTTHITTILVAVAGTLGMLIITVLVVLARRCRKQSADPGRTTGSNRKGTEGMDSFQNPTLLPQASGGNIDDCLYEDVHEMRTQCSRGTGSGELRGSAHDSENSLYATCDTLGLANRNKGSHHDSINSLYDTCDNLGLARRVEGVPNSEQRGSTHDSENSLYATIGNLCFADSN